MLFCYSAVTQAQEEGMDSRNRIHLGIKAGFNCSNVYDEQEEDFVANSKYGFAGGAFLSIPIGKYLGVRPEALFSQKGFYADRNYEGSTFSFSRTTSYIDVPLLVEFKPSPYLTLVGGPQYSYLLDQTDIFSSGEYTSVQQQQFANDNLRKNTLGASFGFDVNLSRFVLGGRYAFDMQSNNGDGTSSIPRYKNRWLQGTVGFRF